jgi:hypothetical protein
MKERKAFDVRRVSIALYSFFIAANGFLFFKLSPYWLDKYSWRCEPMNSSNSKEALQVTRFFLQYQ